jgi:ribosomal protein L16 Arg81 hydroxylase
MNFARLIDPCTVEDFFLGYYEKKFLLNQRDKPGYYDDILSEADLDLFLSQQDLNPTSIRLVKDGVTVPMDTWTKMQERTAGPFKTFVITEELFRNYYNGATIIINSAEKMIPSLTKACSAIQQEMRLILQANIYITPPNSQGFSMHYDDHDIFTLQVKGPKKWRLYDTGEELPTTKKPFKKSPELIKELELHSGDLLYMPRGVVHEAFATDVATIHVNFSCTGLYGFHLLEDLAKIAEDEDVFFRKMIPNSFSSDDEINRYKSAFAKKLTELIEKHDIAELLQMQNKKITSRQIINFNGRLNDALALEKLHLQSLVVRRKGIAFYLEKLADGTTLVNFGKHTISVSGIISLDIFFQDNAFKVTDIKGLMTNNGKLTIVREFIQAGFLQIISN